MNTIPVTVVIPVRNEELNLPACLGCLSDFQKIVVVDSSSTDRTVEIASEFGADVINFRWDGRFPKKRNWVLSTYQFMTTWVLFLDADEHLTPEFVDELRSSLSDSTVSGFWLNYTNYFLGRRLRYGMPQRKLALLRVGAGHYEKIEENRWSRLDMEVHEHPILTGPLGEIRAKIDHRDFKTLHEFIDRHNAYSSWEAARFLQLESGSATVHGLTTRQRKKYRYIHRWWYAPAYFVLSYFGRFGFLDGASGFTYALLKFFYLVQIRLKILEASLRERVEIRGQPSPESKRA